MINFVLGAKILNDKKLWPYGYNFFIPIKNSGIFSIFENASEEKNAKNHLTMPGEIIVNTGDQTSRIVLNSADEDFAGICETLSKLIEHSLKVEEDNIYLSSKKDWVSALGGKSVCLNYACAYDTKLFGELHKIYNTPISTYVPSFERIIISADGMTYFEDYSSGNFYSVKAATDFDEISSIISEAKNLNRHNNTIINYAVDLKFDELFENQKAVLSPAVPVYSTTLKKPVLTARNPLIDKDGELKRDVIDDILSVFKLNINTTRQYPEVNGTLVFVENNGILKITPSGIISYQSKNHDGFRLASGESYPETLSALAKFVDKVNNACKTGHDIYLSETTFPEENEVKFDYLSSGIPVEINFNGHKNAVVAEIKDGNMMSYVQFLRDYDLSNDLSDTPLYIESLDKAIERYSLSINNIEIKKMYLSYFDDGTELPKYADWKTAVKSIEISEEVAQ